MLAVIATGLVVASLLCSAPNVRVTRVGLSGRTVLVVSLLLLFVVLAVTLTVFPPASDWPVPFAHLLLVLGAGLLCALALSSRRDQGLLACRAADHAAIDSLTQVASHRAFQDRLAHECERAYRFGDTFTVLMLDLDDFHLVNNRHSHRVGDMILVHLAHRVRDQLREIDLLARFGGDQFAMILPHTYPKNGVQVAERIRQKVAGWAFATPEGAEVRLTVSMGVCCYPGDGNSPPQLVECAEKALSFAKAMGGNQVQAFRNVPAIRDPRNVVPLPHSRREALVQSLAAAVDIRDGYTHEHSRFVSELSAAVARRIGLAAREVSRIAVGALLHDVGKIGIPDSILTKESSLSPEEWECVKRHPVLGKKILEQAPELADVIPLVLYHQERYDGTGYPYRLSGDKIPLGARIIAAADAYHAIRSDRPYRQGRSHREALHEIRRCAGSQLDPQVVEALLQILESDESIRSILPADPELHRTSHQVAAHSSMSHPLTATESGA